MTHSSIVESDATRQRFLVCFLMSHLFQFKKIHHGPGFEVEWDTPSFFPIFYGEIWCECKLKLPSKRQLLCDMICSLYFHTAVSIFNQIIQGNTHTHTHTRAHTEVTPQIPSLTANLSPLPPPPPSNHHCLATVRHTDTDLIPFSMQVSHTHTHTH